MTNDRGSVSFPCPKCGKSTIIRTKNERQNVATYICSACGFEGPN
ncbi:DUF1610 domain-containing protein [Candidatus Woesearchaeota archaeon]|nr:DUF1610 domain-containing protein [Candidatus Woesearchaeota archaeon]